jgi:hypothetical protein
LSSFEEETNSNKAKSNNNNNTQQKLNEKSIPYYQANPNTDVRITKT